MSAPAEYEPQLPMTSQAPAMVTLTSQVGETGEDRQPSVLNLKLAVSRYDIATVKARDDKDVLVSFEDISQTSIDYGEIPHDDLVYVFNAVDKLREHTLRSKETSGLDITIQKRIPFDTHLGGQAAAAAAVLVALSSLWDVSITRNELARLAQRVGYGVAEAITGGAVITRREATEELVTPVLMQQEIAVVLVPAAADIEDAEVFANVGSLRQSTYASAPRRELEFDDALIQALAQGDASQLALMMHNDFQAALVRILPDHHDWLTVGMNEGALAAQTVERGPSLVCIAESRQHATEIAERFEEGMEIAAVAEYGPVAGASLI